MELLRCENVSFAYDGKYVLRKVDFSLEEKDYLCIVGENGSGKSTLVKGILSLKSPVEGQISFSHIEKNEIGYLPQKQKIQKDFPASVMEVVLTGRLSYLKGRPRYGKEDKAVALENLRLMGMEQWAAKSYQELSGGQQQRVLLARTLCSSRKLIILDEPVTGLDPLATKELYKTISRLNEEEGMAVIMVSHNIHDAVLHANKILHLGERQLFFGSTKTYRNSEVGKEFLQGGLGHGHL